MINGSHVIIYSRKAEADRAFFRDVLKFPHVDAGEGWLVIALPPAELGVHPGEKNDVHEFYLMCDDVHALVAAMKARGVRATVPQDHGWGIVTRLSLPGGGKLGVYQPRHPRPPQWKAGSKKAAPEKGGAKRKAATRKKAAGKKKVSRGSR